MKLLSKSINKLFVALFVLVFLFSFFSSVSAENLATSLKGKILLQVEQNGEAWYVNPADEKRYYMGRPNDAFTLMRELGLGIKHDELLSYLDNQFPSRLAGKILLDVEENGEAYYVYPKDQKGYYLGRPADAFDVMRNLGLGITNENLNKISIFSKNTSLELIDDVWNLYTNNYFGFSMKLPQVNWNSDCGKIIVNEYEDRVEIEGENKEEVCVEQPKSFACVDRGECQSCYTKCEYWTLHVAWVNNEEELASFIDDTYGESCTIGEKTPAEQNGVFKVGCSSGCCGGKQIFYYPEKNISITWGTGNDRTFVLPNDVTADTEMIESFEFIK